MFEIEKCDSLCSLHRCSSGGRRFDPLHLFGPDAVEFPYLESSQLTFVDHVVDVARRASPALGQ